MMPAPAFTTGFVRPMSAFPPDSFIVADVAPSPNFDERKDARTPDMILLHYTGMQTGEAALQRLTRAASKVSSHYVVFEDGRIVQCVPEELTRLARWRSRPGLAKPTSIRARSASRSSIRAMNSAIPIFRCVRSRR